MRTKTVSYDGIASVDKRNIEEDVPEYVDRLNHRVTPYTREQIDSMLDMVERDFAEGRYLTHDEVFRRQVKAVAV